MTVPSNDFAYVHPSIASVLCSVDVEPRNLVCPETLKILIDPSCDVIDTALLIELAAASDRVVFDAQRSLTFRSPLEGLLKLCEDESELAATLLALNFLESSVRCVTGYTAGSAPLLKNMLQQLNHHQLAPILKCLLLPNVGLNLRNLVWHGFMPTLDRRWFALVIVLVYNLESTQYPAVPSNPHTFEVKRIPGMNTLLGNLVSNADLHMIRVWLPTSYATIFDLAADWYTKKLYPACTAALIGVLTEHGLRLEWCRLNHRLEDTIAAPGSYYVTLDGHGQRDRHDLILHPFVGPAEDKNELVHHLGGSAIALLTDLYASSCGGPNIRACLAHGMWDSLVADDLTGMAVQDSKALPDARLWDIVDIMWIALRQAASSQPLNYRPIFSYAATTSRSIDEAIGQLELLEALKGTISVAVPPGVVDLLRLHVSKEIISEAANKLSYIQHSGEEWTSDDVLDEYDSNVALQKCVAARALLVDVKTALEGYRLLAEQLLRELEENESLSTRQHRRIERICGLAEYAASLYSFVIFVALTSLASSTHGQVEVGAGLMLRAIERSRMCVSTFSNFASANTERALKSAVDYTKGKPTKAMLKLLETRRT